MAKQIAVLGAGPMGLAVAYQLARDGYTPVVFEADDRIGGMTASFDFEGTKIERYYHFHCTSDCAFFEVLQELGIERELKWTDTKMGYWYKDRLQEWGNPWALLKFRGLSIAAKLRYGIHAYASTKRNDWKGLDQIEASTWIKRWVGEEAWEVLWRRLFDYKFYSFSDKLSAAWIWSRIRRIGRSRYNIFSEKLGYLEGGSETLLLALQTYIEKNGGVIHLNSPVSKVEIVEGKVWGIEINGERREFDKVISTIPLPFIPKIVPALSQDLTERYASLKNIAVVCVVVKLNRAVTKNFWLNVNDIDMDIPGLVEYTNLRPMDSHIVYVPFYMPAEHRNYQDPNEVFLEKVKKYLKVINKSLRDEDIISMHASRYRYAQPICGPKFLDNLPPYKTSIEGLWIADTSHYYPEDRGISESIAFGRALAQEAMQ